MSDKPLTYKDAGVDIDAGDELVERIKPRVRRTLRPEVLGGLGGFAALFEIPPGRWRRPVTVPRGCISKPHTLTFGQYVADCDWALAGTLLS